MYGGRPLGMFYLERRIYLPSLIELMYFLDVRFNDRWHTFTPDSAKGGQVAPMVAENAP